MPDADQLVELAATLNLRLSPKEAELYLPVILDAMRQLDTFVQSRADESAPPLLYPERGPGYRPSLTEDRYQAWLWKCAIGGGGSGLLAGKTVSYKDHISVAGIPQVFTSQAMEGFVPDVDATVVTRVLAAGGKVTGKHMMNGFMGDYGKPVNPHNPDRITGGSSSGSGAALAAGEVDVSFGGDQGGSIRLPAAYCGVVGLKPTFGLVSHFAVGFAFEPSTDHVGPMARTVPDVAAALQAVAGYDDNDPRQRRDIPESIDALSDLDGGVRGLRIGILEEGFAEPIEPAVAEGVLAAVATLEKLGAEVTRISVPQHAQMDAAYAALVFEGARAIHDVGFFGIGAKTYYPASVITAVDRMFRHHGDMMQPRTKLNHLIAELSRRNYHGGVYAKAHNVRPSYVAAFDRALAKVDVLALPTVRTIAPLVEELPADPMAAIDANPAPQLDPDADGVQHQADELHRPSGARRAVRQGGRDADQPAVGGEFSGRSAAAAGGLCLPARRGLGCTDRDRLSHPAAAAAGTAAAAASLSTRFSPAPGCKSRRRVTPMARQAERGARLAVSQISDGGWSGFRDRWLAV
ncbi:MAG: amidase family protein [Acetobacteraceae bacterium]